jgi:CheY-like chemotaxis protein
MPLVLVIDDQPEIRKMARRILSMAGHSVIEAEDGAAGLKQLASHRPAIILTDILMPGIEGMETIFAIRRTAPEVKVIAMSGSGVEGGFDYLEMAERAGADAVLPKPFRARELTAIVDRLLPLHPPG